MHTDIKEQNKNKSEIWLHFFCKDVCSRIYTVKKMTFQNASPIILLLILLFCCCSQLVTTDAGNKINKEKKNKHLEWQKQKYKKVVC